MRLLAGLAAAAALIFTPFANAHDMGPAVGATVPAVAAQDQAGAQRTFAQLTGRNGLVLVFTRSADWCPYCQAQLIGLESVRGEIEQRGWRLASVSTDDVAKLARFSQMRAIGFPMLSDAPSRLVRAFDIVDPAYPPGHARHGLPVPTIFFLSPQGEVLARLGEADYRVRPAPTLVVSTIDGLP
ncbi:MAG: redoxin domain-containing protein [Alphaproteobacteria bacterium]|nr:redoxin domain-containing protein [Alphaproteobacteria bacterium]